MSLFDTLIGSTSSGNTANTTNTNQNQVEEKNTNQQTSAVTNQNQQQSSSGNTASQTSTKQQNTSQAVGQTSSLNQGVVDIVSGLISNLAGGKGQVNDIVTQLITKASTPAISDADVKAQQDAARLEFGSGEAVQIGQAQNAIGSKNNTYSQLLAQKGDQDLAATLAGIFANAKLQNETLSTQQLMDALQGASIGSQQVAQLVEAIKGANTTTSQAITGATTQDTNAQTVQALLEILQGTNTATQNSNTQEQTAAQASGKSTSNTSGSQGSGLLGWLF